MPKTDNKTEGISEIKLNSNRNNIWGELFMNTKKQQMHG
jgi:hypothetical protein